MAIEPRRLSPMIRETITETAEDIFVSVASVWELGIKRASGKLPLHKGFTQDLVDVGFTILDVTLKHAYASVELPPIHSDPFDRMLLAQAKVEGLVLVTSDRRLGEYGVPTLPATS